MGRATEYMTYLTVHPKHLTETKELFAHLGIFTKEMAKQRRRLRLFRNPETPGQKGITK